jgi:hypothetical protein
MVEPLFRRHVRSFPDDEAEALFLKTLISDAHRKIPLLIRFLLMLNGTNLSGKMDDHRMSLKRFGNFLFQFSGLFFHHDPDARCVILKLADSDSDDARERHEFRGMVVENAVDVPKPFR